MWGKPDTETTCTPCGLKPADRAGGLAYARVPSVINCGLLMRQPRSLTKPSRIVAAVRSPPSYEPIPTPSYDEAPLVLVTSAEAEPIKRNKGVVQRLEEQAEAWPPEGIKNKPQRFLLNRTNQPSGRSSASRDDREEAGTGRSRSSSAPHRSSDRRTTHD